MKNLMPVIGPVYENVDYIEIPTCSATKIEIMQEDDDHCSAEDDTGTFDYRMGRDEWKLLNFIRSSSRQTTNS